MNNEALSGNVVSRRGTGGGLHQPKETKKVTKTLAEPVLLKSEELAARWRITRHRVNQMRAAGQIKVVRLPGGGFRYSMVEILRLEVPVQGCRQPQKARSAEAIKRGLAKARASRASREVIALA
jgi:hypothetical protein